MKQLCTESIVYEIHKLPTNTWVTTMQLQAYCPEYIDVNHYLISLFQQTTY